MEKKDEEKKNNENNLDLSNHSERIEHEDVESNLDLNVQPKEEEKEPEKSKNNDKGTPDNQDNQDGQIDNIVTTTQGQNNTNIKNLLSNLNTANDNDILITDDSFDKKLENLRNKVSQSKLKYSSGSLINTTTNQKNPKMSELFSLLSPPPKFSNNPKPPKLVQPTKYVPLIWSKTEKSPYSSLTKNYGQTLSTIIKTTTTPSPEKKSFTTFEDFMKKRQNQKNSSFCKAYYKAELTSLDEKLFGEKFKRTVKNPGFSSRGKFNRLDLII